MRENEAQVFANFLNGMLEYYPHKRTTAQQALRHPWLKMPKNLNYKLSEQEIKKKLSSRDRANDI